MKNVSVKKKIPGTDRINRYIDLKRFTKSENIILNRALEFAARAHADQKRLSGEPYITHPLHVARMLFEMGFDAEVISAGLLHDTVEDTGITLKDLQAQFGPGISDLVDGVTKISIIKSENIKQTQAENIRKMLLSMVNDIRVILIKLADKIHNMRTLQYLDDEKRQRIARETLDIYAPLAGRLGMARIKVELEDLALKHLEPDIYEDIKNYIANTRDSRERYVERVKEILTKAFKEYGISAQISGRAKHFYSIYNKMKEKERALDEIMDLFAIRIITKGVRECYEALGIVHRLWKPVRGRFKDYIAMPKTNMYQALHTTLVGPEGRSLEVQIRSRDMDFIAEEGIAAHWAYKEGKREISSIEKDLRWLKKLKNWKENLDNPTGFMEDLQKDLLVDEIYVFSPKGDVIELPFGSTPIDFAYKIHTEVGHHCIGAKSNGRIVPLRKPLHSCEVVEIMTAKNAKPSREWLDVVKTSRARHKIRAFFSKLDAVHEEEKPQEPEKEPVVKKKRSSKGMLRQRETIAEYRLVADGEKNVQFHLARCCNPHPGDNIVGYITRGKGITVHRAECNNLRATRDFETRMIGIEWEEKAKKTYSLDILSKDRTGLLMDLATVITGSNANIVELHLQTEHDGRAKARFRLQVMDEKQFKIILGVIREMPEILSLDWK